MFTEAEAIRGEKPGMTLEVQELICFGRGVPETFGDAVLALKNPIPEKADGVCCGSYNWIKT